VARSVESVAPLQSATNDTPGHRLSAVPLEPQLECPRPTGEPTTSEQGPAAEASRLSYEGTAYDGIMKPTPPPPTIAMVDWGMSPREVAALKKGAWPR